MGGAGPEALGDVRFDTVVSIVLGGLVSVGILICGAAVDLDGVNDVADIAKGLEPLYGEAARYCIGIGLLAAGTTSAMTAPLAAAYVARSVLGGNPAGPIRDSVPLGWRFYFWDS